MRCVRSISALSFALALCLLNAAFECRVEARTIPAITGQIGSGCIGWYNDLAIYNNGSGNCTTHIPLAIENGTGAYHDISVFGISYTNTGNVQCRAQVLTSGGTLYNGSWYGLPTASTNTSFTIPSVYVGANDAVAIQCSLGTSSSGYIYTISYTE